MLKHFILSAIGTHTGTPRTWELRKDVFRLEASLDYLVKPATGFGEIAP